MQIPEVVLNSGHLMPLSGMGTAGDPLPLPKQLTPIFIAFAVGYRHFNTAFVCRAEEPFGQAVAEALERGLIKNRDEVFITSKLWCSNVDYIPVLPALKKTLR